MKGKNIAVVADWLVTFAGAEKVIAEFIHLYPNCDLYSVVDFLSASDRKFFNGKKAHTTSIQKFPLAKKYYQKYLPFMPIAIEQLDVSKYDIVLSSSHAVAKGIITGPDQLHISYVHSPLRYAWDLQHQYLKGAGLEKGFKGLLAKYLLHKMRAWDLRTVNGVDYFIANSYFIARRIKKVYGRDATVIYPPVDVNKFSISYESEEYYITTSRLVPYKRVDLIVSAFSRMPNKKLIVIGNGSEMNKIKNISGPNIELLGYRSDEELQNYVKKAKAFVFAAEEDFGITPVEAMACGKPVIAYGKGGVLESVIDIKNKNPTGVFFDEQSEESLISAINIFESNIECFDPEIIRARAEFFSIENFRKNIEGFIQEKYQIFSENRNQLL